MALDLTMSELEMVSDALFQRAADASTEREEDRWHALRGKVGRESVRVERAPCACEHARKSHRADGSGKCIICRCGSFTDAASDRAS